MLRCKKIHTAFPSQDCCQNCAFLFLQTWTIPLLICCLAREDTWKALEAQLGQWKGGPAEHLSSQSRLICCGTTKGNGHCFSKPTSTDPLHVSNFLPSTKEDRGRPMQKWQLSSCSHLKCRPSNGHLHKLKVLEQFLLEKSYHHCGISGQIEILRCSYQKWYDEKCNYKLGVASLSCWDGNCLVHCTH